MWDGRSTSCTLGPRVRDLVDHLNRDRRLPTLQQLSYEPGQSRSSRRRPTAHATRLEPQSRLRKPRGWGTGPRTPSARPCPRSNRRQRTCPAPRDETMHHHQTTRLSRTTPTATSQPTNAANTMFSAKQPNMPHSVTLSTAIDAMLSSPSHVSRGYSIHNQRNPIWPRSK